jgi:hypothetical protein
MTHILHDRSNSLPYKKIFEDFIYDEDDALWLTEEELKEKKFHEFINGFLNEITRVIRGFRLGELSPEILCMKLKSVTEKIEDEVI